jgi:WD40 repeat protein
MDWSACALASSAQNLRIYNRNSLVSTLDVHCYMHWNTKRSEECLISGDEDRKIIIWDLTKYTFKFNLTKVHTSIVTCIKRVSSSRVASADFAGNILIWNWLNGLIVHTLTGHAMAFSRFIRWEDVN